MSGTSGAPREPGGTSRRRRKRKSGKRPKGNSATQANSVVNGVPETDGQIPSSAVNGPVDQALAAQEQPARKGEGASTSQKRRKKRKRGWAATGEGVQNVQAGGLNQDGAERQPDTTTSLKGKKAARRRGRRRKQSANGAESAPVARTNDGDIVVSSKTLEKNTGTPSHRNHELRVRRDGENRPSASRKEQVDSSRNPAPFDRSAGRNNSPLYAALDLGTNNCRLLIARPEDRGFRVVDAYSRIVRLGEGVGSNRMLSDAAMERAIDALAQCHRKLADRGVARSRLIATEACRAAENGADFIERVKAETGLALEVVNRETEARLAVAGCASLVDHDADGVILFDIGGGSSEIVWLDLRNRCGARGYALTRFIRSWISLPVGVVNLAERHGGVHVTPDIFEAMIEDAAEHLAAFNLANNLTEAIASGRVHMLGTSGTVTTLAGVHLGLKRYDRRRVDGTWLEDGDVSRMIDQLRDMPYEARVDNPCIGADRADLVLAGCAILEAIRRRWSCSRLRVADRGLREGILTELMAADGVWSHRKNGSRHNRGRQGNRI
ncbi:Ppx/GppA phosphatase family protein [Roseibium aggregatum]|nr:Ppx/GppA phosphatase family protein [Roseibium aggregatum]WJS00610.1 Ppx/GppA phosphatase family protein [Roseibium aggregatum]